MVAYLITNTINDTDNLGYDFHPYDLFVQADFYRQTKVTSQIIVQGSTVLIWPRSITYQRHSPKPDKQLVWRINESYTLNKDKYMRESNTKGLKS